MMTSLSMTSVEISEFCLVCGIDVSRDTLVKNFTIIRLLIMGIEVFFWSQNNGIIVYDFTVTISLLSITASVPSFIVLVNIAGE